MLYEVQNARILTAPACKSRAITRYLPLVRNLKLVYRPFPEWSVCSVSCGIGVQTRELEDEKGRRNVENYRLCTGSCQGFALFYLSVRLCVRINHLVRLEFIFVKVFKEKMSFKRRIFMRGCLSENVLEDKIYFKWLPQQINLS